jgi:hypothetical protein
LEGLSKLGRFCIRGCTGLVAKRQSGEQGLGRCRIGVLLLCQVVTGVGKEHKHAMHLWQHKECFVQDRSRERRCVCELYIAITCITFARNIFKELYLRHCPCKRGLLFASYETVFGHKQFWFALQNILKRVMQCVCCCRWKYTLPSLLTKKRAKPIRVGAFTRSLSNRILQFLKAKKLLKLLFYDAFM